VLERAGLVTKERTGRRKVVRTNIEGLQLARGLLDRYEALCVAASSARSPLIYGDPFTNGIRERRPNQRSGDVRGRCDRHVFRERHAPKEAQDFRTPLASIDLAGEYNEKVNIAIGPGVAAGLGPEEDDPRRVIRGHDGLDRRRPGGSNEFVADRGQTRSRLR
jgi:hypothetical protein